MATAMPSRRFKVEPIETTVKSSKEMHENIDDSKPTHDVPRPTTRTSTRGYAVEPLKTSSQSSKDTTEKDEEGFKRPKMFSHEMMEPSSESDGQSASEAIETTSSSQKQPSTDAKNSKPQRKFAPEPIETSIKTNRRFAPELVETSVRKSRKKFADEWESQTTNTQKEKKPRKFAPEPIETSSKTNCRFTPEPVETSVRKSRKKFADEWEGQTTSVNKKEKKKSRKFTPQLIDTASRSRRVEDSSPVPRRSNKTETSPSNGSKHCPAPPDNTPTFDYSQNPLFLEIQRATSPLNGRKRMQRCRPSQHCFQIPGLEPIESSESEGSTPASPITSCYTCRPCYFERHSYKEPTRMRESVDEKTSGYFLELAAKAAEKQLREQEMAAFPNGNYHEHVDHFIDHDSESSGSSQGEETIFNEINWKLKARREHHENQDQEEDALSPRSNPWATIAAGVKNDNDIIGYQKNDEVERMRREARPPMLGKDLKFPRCQSPEPARFDTTQGCDAVRIAMCYLSEQTQQAEKGESLWRGEGDGRNNTRVSSLWSTPSSRRETKQSGLWGGCCANTNSPPKGPSGILTPRIETADLLSPCPTPSRNSLFPPTPPASNADFACIDEKLTFALSIDEDYNDDFVTQVYNYLSLGYPSMAQPFDEELSRISKIPVSDLRQDDHLAESKGYIRLGADGNLTDAEITEESCMRWRALRVYIREWAKQQPGMAGDVGAGIAGRKGSWAV